MVNTVVLVLASKCLLKGNVEFVLFTLLYLSDV